MAERLWSIHGKVDNRDYLWILYDRLPGLGAKPILYRTIVSNVIVFSAIELYHDKIMETQRLEEMSQIISSYYRIYLASIVYKEKLIFYL